MASPSTGLTSWNPNVNCTPTLVTVEQIVGNQTGPQGGATQGGSVFNPGITSPYGPDNTKRWLTPSSSTPQGWTSPGPSCTIINANGQIVSAFVQVNGVQRGYRAEEDWNTSFMPINGGSQYPNFSGWEIHPVTAWRISNTSSDFELSASPSSLAVLSSQSANSDITVDTFNLFTGSVSFSTTVSSTSNAVGAPPTATMNPSNVTIASGGIANSKLTIATAASSLGNYTILVTGTNGSLTRAVTVSVDIVDFGVAANPTSVSISIGSSGTSTLTLTSVNGFSGSVSLTAKVAPSSLTAGLSPDQPTAALSSSAVSLQPGGTSSATLTVSASLLTTPGTYIVTITATSGNVSHTTSVTVTVTVAGISL